MNEHNMNEIESKRLDIEGAWFIDPNTNRVQLFRGVNLGGNTKLPVGWTTSNGGTAFDLDHLSFVGKPLPLETAEEHCIRLKYWGVNLLRLLVPWEAINHKGPYIYDEEYIQYLLKLIQLFKKYKFKVFIDPHQDTWSRLCGGSGMPNWTLYLAGLDPRKFKATCAALTMFENDEPLKYPKMTWPTNYGRLATATMFTLFFGGRTFAPKCTIQNSKGELVNIQDYLQDAFCDTYKTLFKRLKEADLLNCTVIGFDTLNEPSEGFIETEDITKLPILSLTSTRNGPTPTVLESFILGEGHACEVAKYSLGSLGFIQEGTMKLDPKGQKVWLKEGESILPNLQFPEWQSWQKSGECIWHLNGVWDKNTKLALDKHYFSRDIKTQKRYHFMEDFWMPFVNKIGSSLRSIHQDIILFIEPPVNAKPPKLKPNDIKERIVYAPHWYDGKTLVTFKFDWWTFDYLGFLRGKYWFIGQALKIGRHDVRKCFEEMNELIRGEGIEAYGEVPMVIGECGIPFNMRDGKAFKDGDYTEQITALEATLNAMERIGSLATIWNYCYDNNHEEGDLWNLEDLSLYSKGTTTSYSLDEYYHKDPSRFQLFRQPIDVGGRALESFIRPYPLFVPGIPLSHNFVNALDSPTKVPYYTFSFKGFPEAYLLKKQTKVVPKCELFLPLHHFPPNQEFNISVNEGQVELIKQDINYNGFKKRYSTIYEMDYQVQKLIWTLEFPIIEEKVYTIKITHQQSAFPSKVYYNSFWFC